MRPAVGVGLGSVRSGLTHGAPRSGDGVGHVARRDVPAPFRRSPPRNGMPDGQYVLAAPPGGSNVVAVPSAASLLAVVRDARLRAGG
jgi:hypothetical protein